jgi:hypothetical protein
MFKKGRNAIERNAIEKSRNGCCLKGAELTVNLFTCKIGCKLTKTPDCFQQDNNFQLEKKNRGQRSFFIREVYLQCSGLNQTLNGS